MPGTPADDAGIRSGDIITGFDGRPVTGLGDLRARIASTPVGEPLVFTIWRKTEEIELSVLSVSDEELRKRLRNQDPEALAAALFDRRYGLGFSNDDQGLLITRVDGDGPANKVLRVGDRLVGVRGVGQVESLSTLNRLLHTYRSLVLHIYRDGRTIAIRLSR